MHLGKVWPEAQVHSPALPPPTAASGAGPLQHLNGLLKSGSWLLPKKGQQASPTINISILRTASHPDHVRTSLLRTHRAKWEGHTHT